MIEKSSFKILIYMAGIILVLLIIVGGTYAYFTVKSGGSTSKNATVTSNTTDILSFSIDRDISFVVSEENFAINGNNQSGYATATATLTPNNYTGEATMNYYLYLKIINNPIIYSSTNNNADPELMLQVFDDNDALVTLNGLGAQKTVKGVTGYDITGVKGLITLLDNHSISASSDIATIENWKVVVTLINLDIDQYDNTGKEFNASFIIRKDAETEYTYWNKNFNNNVTYTNTQIPTGSGLDGTFNSREELALAYSNFSSSPIYIKSTKQGSNILGHNVCIWDNDAELCLEPFYWDSNGSITIGKIQNDFESILGYSSTDYSCSGGTGFISCSFNGFSCQINVDGSVKFIKNGNNCTVNGSGSAFCNNG